MEVHPSSTHQFPPTKQTHLNCFPMHLCELYVGLLDKNSCAHLLIRNRFPSCFMSGVNLKSLITEKIPVCAVALNNNYIYSYPLSPPVSHPPHHLQSVIRFNIRSSYVTLFYTYKTKFESYESTCLSFFDVKLYKENMRI